MLLAAGCGAAEEDAAAAPDEPSSDRGATGRCGVLLPSCQRGCDDVAPDVSAPGEEPDAAAEPDAERACPERRLEDAV